ncbi:MAG: hypothetical protein MK209_05050, partial [Planctomycetes bacterium]|nr:hypothetical protein [Planctomycetota bacterium]
RAYDALDAQRNSGQLTLTGDPKVGSTVSVAISGLAASQPFVLGVGLTPVVIDDESGISLLIDDMVSIRSGTANSVGESVVPIAIPPRSNLVGVSVYVQAGSFSAASVGTNAVEVVICQ